MVKKGVNKMAKVDIISGFLGAGKTTLIKKLLNESLKDEKLVLIENEFGEIGIDGGFMRDAGITVNELSQGCICCSLAGDFETALKEVVDTYYKVCFTKVFTDIKNPTCQAKVEYEIDDVFELEE